MIEELEEETKTDRMQFGFQAKIRTPEAAIEVAAMLEENQDLMADFLDLTKEYDRVSRWLLIRKLEEVGVPKYLINKIIIFPPSQSENCRRCYFSMDSSYHWISQKGTDPPALFRVYIKILVN